MSEWWHKGNKVWIWNGPESGVIPARVKPWSGRWARGSMNLLNGVPTLCAGNGKAKVGFREDRPPALAWRTRVEALEALAANVRQAMLNTEAVAGSCWWVSFLRSKHESIAAAASRARKKEATRENP